MYDSGSTGPLETYNIGSTICIYIDPAEPSRNRPTQLLRLRCGDVGKVEEENIPSPVPQPRVTWRHTDLEGNSAFFEINKYPDEIDDVTYTPPDEFITAFPGLVGLGSPFTAYTDSPQTISTLNFGTANLTRSFVNRDYLDLGMAFGWWECTLSNELGSQTEATFITDSCKLTCHSCVCSSAYQ